MITVEKLMSMDKNNLPDVAKAIDRNDLPQLVEWLSEKDDNIRYQTLLLLQNRSVCSDDVYPFREIFKSKLTSDNSYQRSIGLTLIAENTKWDTENWIDTAIDSFLKILNDEKPITVRQCIQALSKIVPYKAHLCRKIADRLMGIELAGIKETMRKLILLDILNILALIRKYKTKDDIGNIGEIEDYINSSLSGNILDKKAKMAVEAML